MIFNSSILLRQQAFRVLRCDAVRNAVNLSYRMVGKALATDESPILVFHGLLSHKMRWKDIGEIIEMVTKRPVILCDLRNHGTSPRVNSQKYMDMIEDVLLLMEKISIDRACLIGHGAGGKLAMCVALAHPHRVSGLLIVDVSPLSTPLKIKYQFKAIAQVMKSMDFSTFSNISDARKEASIKLMPLLSDEIYLLDIIISNIKKTDSGVIQWQINLDVIIEDFEDIVSFPDELKKMKFDGPCLFIGGQTTDFILPDDLTHLRQIFIKVVVVYMPKVGHYPHVQDPKSFLEKSINFLKTAK